MNSTRAGMLVLLMMAAPTPATAQAGARADTIAGRVIGSDSTAIAHARVSTTGEDGRVYRAQADSAGRFVLVVPRAGGRHQLTTEAFGYNAFTATVFSPAEGGRIERTLRLSPRVVELKGLVVTARKVQLQEARKTPGEASSRWSSLTAESYPVELNDLAAVAAITPGVIGLGGGEFSVAGQAPSQNRTTVDGASFGGGSLPEEGVRNLGVIASTFDVSRGQFSGGQVAATTISGTNAWGGALTARLEDPSLQYGAFPGESFGQRDRKLRLSGGGGGALVQDRLFVYGAADVSRTGGPRAFLDPGDAASLRRLGMEPDSARRFAEVTRRLGLAAAGAGRAGERQSDFVSALARVDYALSERHSLTGRLDWRGSRSLGIAASPYRLPGVGGELRSHDVGVLAQLASGWGLWANELRVYRSAGDAGAGPGDALPTGKVRVASDGGAESAGGVSFLDFGGLSYGLPGEERALWEVADELVRETQDGAHRFKAGVLLQEERLSLAAAQNLNGTFTFHSLADLEAGRPAAYTRTLAGPASAASVRYAALYLGDTWKPRDRLALIYGLRLEGSRYGARDALAAGAGSFVGQSGRVPSDFSLSPRVGFDYTMPSRRVGLRGGVGAFRGTVPLRSLAATWDETGSGTLRLACVGPAAPAPTWQAYAVGAATPSTCADGAPAFADRAPRVALFAPGFSAPRTWRASLDVGGSSRNGLLNYTLGGLVVRGIRLPSALDLNLAPAAAFTLPGEDGRPVYVPESGIDPATGGVAPGASRRDAGLGTVREIGSRGESWTGQFSAGFNALVGKRPQVMLGLNYLLTRSLDLVGGVPAPGTSAATTAGDPARLEWASGDFERRHAFQAMASTRVPWWRSAHISAIAQLASGMRFTPLVAGDVNGDGFSNDRAFVFDPDVVQDAEVARGMARLLEEAPGPVRRCLRAQLGQIAGRSSCQTPWTPSLDLRADFLALGNVRTRRLQVSITAANVTAGLDYLLHGADGLRGWGQYPYPDAMLLEVRGFDPGSRAFRYAVNPRFGAPLGGGMLRTPFKFIVQGRMTIGADPRYQPLLRDVERMRAANAPQIRSQLAERVRNAPGVVVALSQDDPDALSLTPEQESRLRAAAERIAPQLSSALDALAAALMDRGPATAARQARLQTASERVRALGEAGLQSVREILSAEQWAKLPAWLTTGSAADELDRPVRFEATMPSGGF